MRQIRQTLRLHLEAGLSYAQVARAVGIGKGTVGKVVLLARAAGVDWALAQTLTTLQSVTTHGIVMKVYGLEIPVTYTPAR